MTQAGREAGAVGCFPVWNLRLSFVSGFLPVPSGALPLSVFSLLCSWSMSLPVGKKFLLFVLLDDRPLCVAIVCLFVFC